MLNNEQESNKPRLPDFYKADVSRRAWLFQGTNERKFQITIYVSATDRESAIAHFETDYPQYNWWATVECPVLCG